MANELTKQDGIEIMALNGEFSGLTPAEIAEEMGGDLPQYPRVKMPSGGMTAFEVPGDDPESPDAEKELRGVIVWHHKTNAYWPDNDNDAPPACRSEDGVRGDGVPGGDCATCPYNQFGSGEGGRGKACKNGETLYILREHDILPVALSLSPTSLAALRNYKTMCVARGKRVCDVVTSITLTKKVSADGNPYSVAVFRRVGELSPETAAKALAYRKDVQSMLAVQRAVRDQALTPTVDQETGEVFA